MQVLRGPTQILVWGSEVLPDKLKGLVSRGNLKFYGGGGGGEGAMNPNDAMSLESLVKNARKMNLSI